MRYILNNLSSDCIDRDGHPCDRCLGREGKCNEFNLGAYMITKEGVIYFGGIYGYNYFRPEELSSNKKDISVTFSKFKLDGNWLKPNEKGSPLILPILKTDELNLSYRQRSFTVAFQSSDLSNPKKINYKYL